jgi:hypothetical protein
MEYNLIFAFRRWILQKQNPRAINDRPYRTFRQTGGEPFDHLFSARNRKLRPGFLPQPTVCGMMEPSRRKE